MPRMRVSRCGLIPCVLVVAALSSPVLRAQGVPLWRVDANGTVEIPGGGVPTHVVSERVGDVVLYKMPNRQRVLHRLIAIEAGEDGGRQFIFKGDNNNAADLYPVRDEQIVGRLVFDVPKLGWIPLKFQQGLGKLR